MEKRRTCEWYLNRDDLTWHSECGFECALPDDSIAGSDWEFCPFCAADLVEIYEDARSGEWYTDIVVGNRES